MKVYIHLGKLWRCWKLACQKMRRISWKRKHESL